MSEMHNTATESVNLVNGAIVSEPMPETVTRSPRILPVSAPTAPAPVKASPKARKAVSRKPVAVGAAPKVKRVPGSTIAALRAHRTRAAQLVALLGKAKSKAQIAARDAAIAKVAAYDAQLALLAPNKATKATGSQRALKATVTRLQREIKNLTGAARKAKRVILASVNAKLDALSAA